MTMHYLVAYLNNPSGSDLRLLQRLFKRDVPRSILPVVSHPFESAGEADIELQRIRQARVCGQGQDVIIQPGEEDISPMSEQSAVHLVKGDESWARLLDGFGASDDEPQIGAREHPRCWLLVATVVQGGIPPGAAFLIDKHSKRIFPRRYVDALSLDGELL